MSNASPTVSNSISSPSPSPDCDERCAQPGVQRRVVKESTLRYCTARAPMLQLPARFAVNPESMKLGRSPPTLCFGFGVSPGLVYKYAEKKGLVDESLLLHFGGRQFLAFHKAVRYLELLTRAHKLRVRIPVSLDQIYVIALYDNYTKDEDEMLGKDEKEVLEMLREELGLPVDEPAMWYYVDV